MRTIQIAMAILAASMWAAPAAAGGRTTPDGWAARMLAAIAGPDGAVTREGYRAMAEGYVRLQSAYAQDVYGPRMSGSPSRAEQAARMIERMVEDAERYVRGTEDGLFSLLDPDGDGHVAGPEARAALAVIGRLSDLDGNGVLDRQEQGLAEAALAGGVDLSDQAARDSLLWALERTGGYLD